MRAFRIAAMLQHVAVRDLEDRSHKVEPAAVIRAALELHPKPPLHLVFKDAIGPLVRNRSAVDREA